MNENIDEINSLHDYYIDKLQEQDYKSCQREEKLQQENQQLKEQLQQRDEVIEKIVSQVWYMQNNEPANSNEYDFYCRKLIWIATQKENQKESE